MNGPLGITGRILGPVGLDLGCDHSGDLLDQFVETELAGLAAREAFPEVANHLEACPDCREDYVALTELLKAARDLSGRGSA